MRLLTIKQCRPGMRLAKRIFSEDGIVLLGKHMELTEKLIVRLENSNVYYVYVEDERTDDICINSIISDDTFRMAITEIKKSFNSMTCTSNRNRHTRPFIAKSLKHTMNCIFEELIQNKDAMIMLMNMGTVDNYLYQHSMNVCVYTTLLAQGNGFSRDEVINIGLGALLHDIGKIEINTSVLKKPDALTFEEFEHMKEHTTRGFAMLKDQPNLSLSIAHCALQHHERLDGSGYPRGITGEQISEHAKWIGIVDSYDAMTTSRIYSSPILPHEAMERLYAGSGILYERDMLTHFRDKVVLYPIGISVKLSNGLTGIVSDYHPSYPHRPIVRILQNEEGEDIKIPYEIDMSTHLNIMITSVNDEVIKS